MGEDISSDRPDQKLTPLPFMAEMLTEVFSGTPELCLRVNEEHIKNIFKLIIRSKEDPIGQLALLSTLSTIAKVCMWPFAVLCLCVLVCSSVSSFDKLSYFSLCISFLSPCGCSTVFVIHNASNFARYSYCGFGFARSARFTEYSMCVLGGTKSRKPAKDSVNVCH